MQISVAKNPLDPAICLEEMYLKFTDRLNIGKKDMPCKQ